MMATTKYSEIPTKDTKKETSGERRFAFVGFQEPLAEIPAGALVRISLAHWWRPRDHPEEEERCYLQLSGWFLPQKTRTEGCQSAKLSAQDRRMPQR